MDFSFWTMMKVNGVILATITCYACYKNTKAKKKELSTFLNQEIKDLSNLKKMKEGQQKYFKAKLQNNTNNKSNTIQLEVPISYNQFYLEEPSDVYLLNKLKRSQTFSPIFPDKTWNFVDSLGNKNNFQQIQLIVGDIYNIKHRFQEHECSILKRIWGGLCYCVQFIFDFMRKSQYNDPLNPQISEYRRPFIMGPVMGVLHYSIGLITDSYFVLKVKFQNGLHRVVLLAESKNSIMGIYQTQIIYAQSATFIIGTVAILFGYSLYKQLKRLPQFQNIVRRVQQGNKKLLQIQNIDQDKSCIICYSSCRNLVLFDCKHLIMCWYCWKTIKDQKCPLCKIDITTAKIIQPENVKLPRILTQNKLQNQIQQMKQS